MRIKFWGTRGSIAAPGKETLYYGGNTTCLELVLTGGTRVVLDAGTGLRPLGDQLNVVPEPVDIVLLISHIHWDHITGFPFFAPIYERDTKIRVDGFPTCMQGLRVPFDNRLGDGIFPVRFEELKAEIDYLHRLEKGPLYLEGTRIDAAPLQHPQGGFGFRFQEDGKTLVFLTDNELTEDAWADRSPEDFARFCEGADILIHDAQYTSGERQTRRGWGHSDHESAVNLALRAGVGRLILFHHDPARTDDQLRGLEEYCRRLAAAGQGTLEVETAREGSSITL